MLHFFCFMGLRASVLAVNELTSNQYHLLPPDDNSKSCHRLNLLRKAQLDHLPEDDVRRLLEVMSCARFDPLLDEWAIVADKLPQKLWVPYFRWTGLAYDSSKFVALFRRFALIPAIATPSVEYCKYAVSSIDWMLHLDAPVAAMLKDIWNILLRHDSSFWDWFWYKVSKSCLIAPTLVPGTAAFSSFLKMVITSHNFRRWLFQRQNVVLLSHPETQKFLAPHMFEIWYMFCGVVNKLQPALIDAALYCPLTREAAIVYRFAWIAACVL
jgi:hypothetical protein